MTATHSLTWVLGVSLAPGQPTRRQAAGRLHTGHTEQEPLLQTEECADGTNVGAMTSKPPSLRAFRAGASPALPQSSHSGSTVQDAGCAGQGGDRGVRRRCGRGRDDRQAGLHLHRPPGALRRQEGAPCCGCCARCAGPSLAARAACTGCVLLAMSSSQRDPFARQHSRPCLPWQALAWGGRSARCRSSMLVHALPCHTQAAGEAAACAGACGHHRRGDCGRPAGLHQAQERPERGPPAGHHADRPQVRLEWSSQGCAPPASLPAAEFGSPTPALLSDWQQPQASGR